MNYRPVARSLFAFALLVGTVGCENVDWTDATGPSDESSLGGAIDGQRALGAETDGKVAKTATIAVVVDGSDDDRAGDDVVTNSVVADGPDDGPPADTARNADSPEEAKETDTDTSSPEAVVVDAPDDDSSPPDASPPNTDASDAKIPATGAACTSLKSVGQNRIASLLSSSDRIGFGAMATGGKTLFEVRNLRSSGDGSLADALSRSGRWIYFTPGLTGTINASVGVPANTTIDGRGADITISANEGSPGVTGSEIIAGTTQKGASSNVILECLTVIAPEVASGVTFRGGTDYWLDHLTITSRGSSDGIAFTVPFNAPSTNLDSITISNYFRPAGSSKNILLDGPSDPRTPSVGGPHTGDGRISVTVHSSDLHAADRGPRTGWLVDVHSFNNYVADWRYTGMALHSGARAISENNHYDGAKANNANKAVRVQEIPGYPSSSGYSTGDHFTSNAGTSNMLVNTAPFDISYSYVARPASEVRSYVENNAGVR